VAIIGGGVAGLSAAHHLAKKGFEVSVYENKPIFGGKARSIGVPNSASPGQSPLPGEHGFRFFPGFYQHLPATVKDIPYNGSTVFDNLVETKGFHMAQVEREDIFLPTNLTCRTPWEFFALVQRLNRAETGLSASDLLHFGTLLWTLLTSCKERRDDSSDIGYESRDWWDFSGAENRSARYRRVLVESLTRTMVAAQAKEMSVKTGGNTLIQLQLDMMSPGGQVDRVLNGPTNDVWINPWVEYLRQPPWDVRFHGRHRVERGGIHCQGNRVTGITVTDLENNKRPDDVKADFYVAAVPVEIMIELTTPELIAAEPRLADLANLRTRWMNGIQYYLTRDFEMVHGHSLYLDSPWALTSISQQRFWPRLLLKDRGNGDVEGVLSVDISDWDATARDGKTAKQCTKDEIALEVWRQILDHVDEKPRKELEREDPVGRKRYFLDDSIYWPNPAGVAGNLEPLLINTKGSWALRPPAVTSIENFFLASDYVQTETDLATMEGANEAARVAVNGILEASGSNEPKCDIYGLREPWWVKPWQELDRWRFRRKLPYRMPPLPF
jgi:uncharacterized protein with NAD-binding domain and iron-sulfur cluster